MMRTALSGPLAALFLTFALTIGAAPPRADAAARPPILVPEAYVSAENPGEELDSLATWRHPDGTVWLMATAKSSHRLVVFDASTGARLRDVGAKGSDPGQFKRPNGIAVHGDLLFVAERDNHRIQALSLPGFRPLGTFGEPALRSPYGLWLNPQADGAVEVYVTDNFMQGTRFDVVPPLAQLDQRVRRYRVHIADDGALRAEDRGHFGDTGEKNALRIVESIAGDAAHNRLLIADEYQPQSTLREYTLAGKATGRHLPENTFAFEAEGVALWSCGRHRGYWVAVDQLSPLTVFHFFDRRTLAQVGSFTGRTAAATDGIALRAAPSPGFPKGALFAVHDDKSVAAFDLGKVAAALKLDRACL